jgi:hypothetical protein
VVVGVAGTGYVPLHAPAPQLCGTAAIADRRRTLWRDWRFDDGREDHCRRVIGTGDVFVQLASRHGTARFCVACACHVLRLPVAYEPDRAAGGDSDRRERRRACC